MRYPFLGKSGLRVSELVLGTMTFGDDWRWGAAVVGAMSVPWADKRYARRHSPRL